MIPSGEDYSTHDKVFGGLVLVILLAVFICWRSGHKVAALVVPWALFAGAVLIEMRYPGIVDGIR